MARNRTRIEVHRKSRPYWWILPLTTLFTVGFTGYTAVNAYRQPRTPVVKYTMPALSQHAAPAQPETAPKPPAKVELASTPPTSTTDTQESAQTLEEIVRPYKLPSELLAERLQFVDYIQNHTIKMFDKWKIDKRYIPDYLSMIDAESEFNHKKKNGLNISTAGARGLVQMMPQTFEGLPKMVAYLNEKNGTSNTYDYTWDDFTKNVEAANEAGVIKFGQIIRMVNGNVKIVLATYNAGEGRVRDAKMITNSSDYEVFKWRLPKPGETVRYVNKVLPLSQEIRRRGLRSVIEAKELYLYLNEGKKEAENSFAKQDYEKALTLYKDLLQVSAKSEYSRDWRAKCVNEMLKCRYALGNGGVIKANKNPANLQTAKYVGSKGSKDAAYKKKPYNTGRKGA